jgi:hypothetical protein
MKKQALILGAALLLPFAFAAASAAAPRPAGEVTIINTGDRLTPGYRVTVGPRGSLTAVVAPAGRHAPIHRTNRMDAVNQKRFFADLASAEPLANLASGSQPTARRSRRGRGGPQAAPARVNPYPQVFVRYQGRQSPNLRTASSQNGRVLYQDVKQILQVLRLPIPDVP